MASVHKKYIYVDNKWEKLGSAVMEGGTSGDGTMKYDYTTNIEVGGIPVDTVINSTDLIADILKQMLVKTFAPTFVAPSAALSYAGSTTLAKVGATISAQTGRVTFNPGAINLQGTKQADRAGTATNYTLSTSGATTDFSDSNTTGTFNVTALTRSTKGNVVLTGTVAHGAGPQPKDSNGDDYGSPLPAGSVTTTKTIEFILPFYYGVSNNSTISDFTGLTENLSKKGTKTFRYTTVYQHVIFAYDASYNNLTSIKDPNGYETISGWTKSSLTVDGQNYNVYIQDLPTTDTDVAYTFAF